MSQSYTTVINDIDEDININLGKIWNILWSRKAVMVKAFCFVLIFFIVLTFVLPKKYKVTADLYINKTNSSNMMEFNPYILGEASGSMLQMATTDRAISNELEILRSSLVLDKVIRDNHLVYKKKYGIFPNKKEGEYLTAKDFYKKGKILKIENIKNTSVITVEYKDKNPEVSYGIISSLIKNYVDLHKKINIEKAKTDTRLLADEYEQAKKSLDQRLAQAGGVPAQSLTGIGNLTAMSAFSKSASKAVGSMKSQYIAGERSQIAIGQEREKVSQLAAKLEWARMVDKMSDTSKVLILNKPQKLRPFENTSPKLIINILLGIVFGFVASVIALIISEVTDKKLAYSMLANNIIYDAENNIKSIRIKIFGCNPQKVLLISLTQISEAMVNDLKSLSNADIVPFEMSSAFVNKISNFDKVILISKISETDAGIYKNVKEIVKNLGKEIVCDALV